VNYHSYPSIFNLGHNAVRDIFQSDVAIEEKIDGSQFSFGLLDGELACASKRRRLILDAPEKLFKEAVATAQELAPMLRPNWLYRGEYLTKPKHNALAYDRIPTQHIMIYDIVADHEENYLNYEAKMEEALRLGLECVPLVYQGPVASADLVRELLKRESALGGAKIEGVVIKNYGLWGPDKKVLMAKFVSEEFKEKHAAAWKISNPRAGDIIYHLIQCFRTEARWNKAIQHLREDGLIEDAPRDIGKLILEVKEDVERECKEEMLEALYKWAAPKVLRAVTAGLPEWYKQRLLNQQFEVDDGTKSGS